MITFRTHERSDIPNRVKWLNNKNANTFAIDDPEQETTLAEQEAWFDRYEADKQKKFFTICEDGKPIGFVGLSKIDPVSKSGNVFIMIGEDDYRGKGIGKQTLNFLMELAFKKLGLKTLTLDVDKRNEPAVRLYQSAGFKKTADLEDEMIEMRLSV